jgi:3-dehydro-L-gulonate 2-dehydrogenase
VARVLYEELVVTMKQVLLKVGFTTERASLCARLFVEASCDGIYSHGLNRFPRFIESIKAGIVDVEAEPTLVQSFGAMERWDGNSGPGNLNAH